LSKIPQTARVQFVYDPRIVTDATKLPTWIERHHEPIDMIPFNPTYPISAQMKEHMNQLILQGWLTSAAVQLLPYMATGQPYTVLLLGRDRDPVFTPHFYDNYTPQLIHTTTFWRSFASLRFVELESGKIYKTETESSVIASPVSSD
jgi:hypothetical protein